MPALNEASVLTTKSVQLISASAALAVIIAAIVMLTTAASTRIATPGPDADLERMSPVVVAKGAAGEQAKRTEFTRDTNDGRPRSDKFFFGFLEFDWDPDAPGGVPGFGPHPPSPTLGVAAVKD